MQGFAIDTLKIARRLRDAGFHEAQVDAFVATFQEAAETSDVVSKGDLRDVETSLRQAVEDLRAEVADFRAQLRQTETALRGEIAAVRAELRETELRHEAKIEAVRAVIGEAKADVLTRIFAVITGAAP
jgi:DNA-binding transcriptional MerR regulator